MSPHQQDGDDQEEPLDDWIARYDDALREGRTPPDPASREQGGDEIDLGRLREMLERLHQVLRPGPIEGGAKGSDTDGGDGEITQVDQKTIGRYRIVRGLGRGGFGIVLLADDPTMGRRVALKIPRADAVALPETRRRFLREAQAAARLDHPNLVPVYDSGEDDHFCYIASAYCEGPTLRAWIKAGHAPADPRLAARLVLAMAEAIEHMHARGLLHCDLKPGNVLLELPGGSDPVPRITDFGLARLAETVAGDSTTMQLWGTPPYMAPEQILMRRDEIGPQADIHALGAILCELLCGRPPHEGSGFALTQAVVSQPPRSPRSVLKSVPADLDAIVLRCLEKNPGARYERAGDLADDLERFLDLRPTRARPLGPIRRALRWSRRHPASAALIVLAFATVGASVGYSIALSRTVAALDRSSRSERAHYRVATIALADSELRRGRPVQAQRRLRELLPASGEPDERDFAWHYTFRLAQRDRTVLDELFPGTAVVLSAQPGILLGAGGEREGAIWRFDWRAPPGGTQLGPMRVRTRFVGRTVEVAETFAGALFPDGRLAALVGSASSGTTRTIHILDLESGRTCLWMGEPTLKQVKPPYVRGHITIDSFGGAVAIGADPSGHSVPERITRTRLVVGTRPVDLIQIPGANEVAFSSDGKTLASGIADNPADTRTRTLKLWDITSGECIASLDDEPIYHSLAFSPLPGGPIATSTLDGALQLRDPMSGQVLRAFDAPALIDHQYPGIHCLAFALDGQQIAAGYNRFAIIWDLRTGQPLARIDDLGDWVASIAFLPGSSRDIALGIGTGEVVIWHLDPVEPAKVIEAHSDEVWGAVYDPAGEWLATVGGDHLIRLWDAQTGELRETLAGPAGWPSTLAIDPMGRWLASADFKGIVTLWDLHKHSLSRALEAHTKRIRAIAFSPDGRWLATGGHDPFIRVWETDSGKLIAELPRTGEPGKPIRGLAFSPDGRTLASVDLPIVLWDTSTWRRRSLWERSVEIESTSLAYSPDGRNLATADRRGVVTLWDAASGTMLAELTGLHTEEVSHLAFSPDNRILAAAGQDAIVSLIDVETGRSHISLTGHEKGVNAVAWSPDGRTLASASHDHTLRLWWAGPPSP